MSDRDTAGRSLNAKQARFVEEYIIDLNATQAAIRAGYSEKTAHSQGPRLLENVGIQAAITDAQARRSERTEITADRVLTEFGRIGLSDVRKLFTEDGQLRAIHELDDDTAAALASVEVVTKRLPGNGDEPPEVEYVHKLKFWDKNSSLEKIGKHLGMFIERHEHTGAGGGPIQTVTANLTNLSDEELAQLERLTDKTRDQTGMGEA